MTYEKPFEKVVHVGDVGTAFVVEIREDCVAIDVSGATDKKIYLRKPSGAVLTRPADFDGDGADGKIKYVAVEGEIDEAGEWKLEGWVELPGGKWFTTVVTFQVDSTLA